MLKFNNKKLKNQFFSKILFLKEFKILWVKTEKYKNFKLELKFVYTVGPANYFM